MSERKYPMTSLLQSIDDESIKNVMQYFQFEDYDLLLGYMQKIGIRLPSKKKETLPEAGEE